MRWRHMTLYQVIFQIYQTHHHTYIHTPTSTTYTNYSYPQLKQKNIWMLPDVTVVHVHKQDSHTHSCMCTLSNTRAHTYTHANKHIHFRWYCRIICELLRTFPGDARLFQSLIFNLFLYLLIYLSTHLRLIVKAVAQHYLLLFICSVLFTFNSSLEHFTLIMQEDNDWK